MDLQTQLSVDSADCDVRQGVHNDFLEFAATLIQSAYRGYKVRKSYDLLVSIFDTGAPHKLSHGEQAWEDCRKTIVACEYRSGRVEPYRTRGGPVMKPGSQECLLRQSFKGNGVPTQDARPWLTIRT
jgi:hypothetical protein